MLLIQRKLHHPSAAMDNIYSDSLYHLGTRPALRARPAVDFSV